MANMYQTSIVTTWILKRRTKVILVTIAWCTQDHNLFFDSTFQFADIRGRFYFYVAQTTIRDTFHTFRLTIHLETVLHSWNRHILVIRLTTFWDSVIVAAIDRRWVYKPDVDNGKRVSRSGHTVRCNFNGVRTRGERSFSVTFRVSTPCRRILVVYSDQFFVKRIHDGKCYCFLILTGDRDGIEGELCCDIHHQHNIFRAYRKIGCGIRARLLASWRRRGTACIIIRCGSGHDSRGIRSWSECWPRGWS